MQLSPARLARHSLEAARRNNPLSSSTSSSGDGSTATPVLHEGKDGSKFLLSPVGQCFNIMGLFTDRKQTISVRSLTHADIYKLPREQFETIVRDYPGEGLAVADAAILHLSPEDGKLASEHVYALVNILSKSRQHFEHNRKYPFPRWKNVSRAKFVACIKELQQQEQRPTSQPASRQTSQPASRQTSQPASRKVSPDSSYRKVSPEGAGATKMPNGTSVTSACPQPSPVRVDAMVVPRTDVMPSEPAVDGVLTTVMAAVKMRATPALGNLSHGGFSMNYAADECTAPGWPSACSGTSVAVPTGRIISQCTQGTQTDAWRGVRTLLPNRRAPVALAASLPRSASGGELRQSA